MLWSKYLLSPVSQSHQISKSLSLYLSLSLCVLAFVFYHRLWSIVGKSHNSVESPLNAFMALIIRGPADRPSMSLIEFPGQLKKTILAFISPSPPMRRKKLPWLCSFSDVLYFFSLIWKRNWGIEEYHLDLQRQCIVHGAFWYRLWCHFIQSYCFSSKMWHR